jgi:serine/threonine-protein kinase
MIPSRAVEIPAPLAAMPSRLGRYEVRGKVAEGGMAVVYVGRFLGLPGDSRVVALKVIKGAYSANREFVNMFLDEAKLVSRLIHPNIVRLYELGAEAGELYIAMEFLRGQSLWQVWQSCRERSVRLRYDTIAWMGARIADALHYAHELHDENGTHLQIVHRDVNATNIFVTYDGDVKVIDFGLAKAENRVSRTAAGVIKGKAAYMSPEQTIGKPLDRRTDVFALGTTLWELSVDRRLFKEDDDVATLKRVHAADVPDPCALVDGYPAELSRILRRALAREKEDRYATAEQFARDLDAFADMYAREERAHEPAREVGAEHAARAQLARAMDALFAEERSRLERWLDDARASDKPAPRHTLRPRGPGLGDAMPRIAMPLSTPSPRLSLSPPPPGLFEMRPMVPSVLPPPPRLPAGGLGLREDAALANRRRGQRERLVLVAIAALVFALVLLAVTVVGLRSR